MASVGSDIQDRSPDGEASGKAKSVAKLGAGPSSFVVPAGFSFSAVHPNSLALGPPVNGATQNFARLKSFGSSSSPVVLNGNSQASVTDTARCVCVC